jgi:Cd2+/Zn2+-exporting ATPase
LRALALDKTGTITFGKPAVTDVVSLQPGPINRVLQLAAAGGALGPPGVARHRATGRVRHLEVSDFAALAGRGVQGRIAGNCCTWAITAWCTSWASAARSWRRAACFRKQGKTTTVLCREGQPQLLLAVADTVRPSSKEAVAELQALGVRSSC